MQIFNEPKCPINISSNNLYLSYIKQKLSLYNSVYMFSISYCTWLQFYTQNNNFVNYLHYLKCNNRTWLTFGIFSLIINILFSCLKTYILVNFTYDKVQNLERGKYYIFSSFSKKLRLLNDYHWHQNYIFQALSYTYIYYSVCSDSLYFQLFAWNIN